MDPTQQVRGGRKLDRASTPERTDTRVAGTSSTARSEPRPVEKAQPLFKSKHWKLLYASKQPADPESSPLQRENCPARSREQEQDSNKYKGLCKNCTKQDSCELPKPEGGVWRCEDYE